MRLCLGPTTIYYISLILDDTEQIYVYGKKNILIMQNTVAKIVLLVSCNILLLTMHWSSLAARTRLTEEDSLLSNFDSNGFKPL